MRQLTRDQYLNIVAGNKHLPPISIYPTQEREWWSDAHLVGLVLRDQIDADWSWVVLGPDLDGALRCIELRVSQPSQDAARAQLHAEMAAILSTGQTVFPQD